MSGANSLGGNILQSLRIAACAAALGLQACGGGGEGGDPPPPPPAPAPATQTYPVSVVVSGLNGDDLGIRLTWNSGGSSGSETISVNANGTVQFAQAVAVGGEFSIEITRQPGPEPELCEVAVNQSATVLATGAPTPQVECHRQYRLGGVVNGLDGQGLTLVNATTGGMENLAVNGSGVFTFPTALDPDAAYAVSVSEQPTVPAQSCAITNGSGTMPEADVTDIVVACIDVNAEAWRAWRVTRKADGPEEIIDETPDYPDLAPGNDGLHEFDLGKTSLDYDGTVDQKAWSRVFSTADGTQYSVDTQAPDRKASSAVYRQIKNYRKDKEGAVLLLRVPYAMLKAYNDNLEECTRVLDLPAYSRVQQTWICTLVDPTEVRLEYFARVVRIPGMDGMPGEVVAGTALEASVSGRIEDWTYGAYRSITGANMRLLSDISDAWLSWSGDLTNDETYRLVSLQLTNPVDIELDLSSIAVGEIFQVSIEQGAYADNSDRESYAEASFRLPAGSTGPQLHATDLTEMPVEKEVPIPAAPPPLATCPTGSDPTTGGTIAFSAPSYFALEMNGRTQAVLVTRTGGSTGPVDVTVTTASGSALAGSDYSPFAGRVHFPDGDTTPRLVRVSILDDDEEEADESLTFRLSPPAGCATLAAPAEATIVIVDDERQPEPTTPLTYTVGGTVSGLTGTGLVISNSNLAHDQLTPSNGAFTFPTPLVDGASYSVQVETQPENPRQICTVTNGTGMITGAHVTDVAIACENAPLAGSVDVTFGNAGVASGAPTGGAHDMAMYSDGRFVLMNTSRRLARYLASGDLDPTFGSGGAVSLTFPSGADYYLEGVAVQPDGKVVVAGYAIELPSGKNDVLVARLNADGTFDTSFGFGGRLTTRVTDFGARANFVRVQPDGKLLVGGFAATSAGNTDAMLLRYLPDGSLDTSFGTVGLVLLDVSGYDEAYTGALYPDGRIAITGRTGNDGAAQPDTLIARFLANGAPDTSFVGIGATRRDVGGGGTDYAHGIAVQGDGKIVTAGTRRRTSTSTEFVVLRVNEDGSPDQDFGSDGIVNVSLTGGQDAARAVAVQADGKIVAAGFALLLPNADFGVLRLESDGTPDADFGTDGILQHDFFGQSDGAQSVGLQPDGRIVVAGTARDASVDVSAVIRLVP